MLKEVLDTVRRNHALEHATITLMLAQRGPMRVVGRAGTDGFFVWANVPTDLEGTRIGREEFERRLPGWIPGDADKAYVRGLMRRVAEPGKMAAWIAPPERGINNLPVDYEYVRMS